MEFDIEKELEELEELLKGNNFKSKVYLSFDCLDKFFKSQDFIEIVASANFNHNSFSETRNFISNILYIATSYVETFGTIATASYDEMKKLIKNIVLHANENSNKLANLDIESVITGMIENKLFKDLNISKKNATKEQIEMVKCQAVDLVNYSANKYHAFNSKDLDSILANGIDPNSKDKQVEKDKREIDKIFSSHGKINVFPFLEGDTGKVSYSRESKLSYEYSYASPEWFKLFCGDNYFGRRSYQDAKTYVKNLCNSASLNEKEQETVISFFDKYWNMYTNTKHMLAIVPNEGYKSFNDEAVNEIKNYDIDEAIRIIVRDKGAAIDEKSDTAIPVQDGSIIELPDVQKTMEKVVAFQNKKQLEN